MRGAGRPRNRPYCTVPWGAIVQAVECRAEQGRARQSITVRCGIVRYRIVGNSLV